MTGREKYDVAIRRYYREGGGEKNTEVRGNQERKYSNQYNSEPDSSLVSVVFVVLGCERESQKIQGPGIRLISGPC